MFELPTVPIKQVDIVSNTSVLIQRIFKNVHLDLDVLHTDVQKRIRLRASLDDLTSLILMFGLEMTNGYLQVPITLQLNGVPHAMTSSTHLADMISRKTVRNVSVERMTLRNDCDSDFEGWLYLVKNTYDDLFQPPKQFMVTDMFSVLDTNKQKSIKFDTGTLVDVHPSSMGIRKANSIRFSTSLEHPSWTCLDKAVLWNLPLKEYLLKGEET